MFSENKCTQCHKDKIKLYENKCAFSMNKYKGRKEAISGFYVAYVDRSKLNYCMVYCGVMK